MFGNVRLPGMLALQQEHNTFTTIGTLSVTKFCTQGRRALGIERIPPTRVRLPQHSDPATRIIPSPLSGSFPTCLPAV